MKKVGTRVTYLLYISGGHVVQSSPRELLSMAHLFLLLLKLKSVMSTWNVSESFAVGTYPTAYLSRRVKISLMPTAASPRVYWQNPPFFTLSEKRTYDTLRAYSSTC